MRIKGKFLSNIFCLIITFASCQDGKDSSNQNSNISDSFARKGPKIKLDQFSFYKYDTKANKGYGILRNGYSLALSNSIYEAGEALEAYFINIPGDEIAIPLNKEKYWEKIAVEFCQDLGIEDKILHILKSELFTNNFKVLKGGDELFFPSTTYENGEFAITIDQEGLGETIVKIYISNEPQ